MKYWLLAMVICSHVALFGQEAEVTPKDSIDYSTVDGIVKAYYKITSGPAGKRDWKSYRTLFRPEAQINARVFNMDGKLQYVHGTLDEYIGMVDEYFTINAYFEQEIGRQTHQYQDIAQVFSAYQNKLATNQKTYHRGIKSLQLVFDQKRWWIVNILYNNESVKTPIPNEMLFEKYREE